MGPLSTLTSIPKATPRLTPAILIETAGGSYVWDCAAYISPQLISHLLNLPIPLKAMAISHPHVPKTIFLR